MPLQACFTINSAHLLHKRISTYIYMALFLCVCAVSASFFFGGGEGTGLGKRNVGCNFAKASSTRDKQRHFHYNSFSPNKARFVFFFFESATAHNSEHLIPVFWGSGDTDIRSTLRKKITSAINIERLTG